MKKIGHTIDRFPPLGNSTRVACLLAVVLLAMGLLPVLSSAQEPTPRPTPTPVLLLELTPQSGMPGTNVLMRGYGFQAVSLVDVLWDEDPLLDDVAVQPDGSFETQFQVPADEEGEHVLRVMVAGDPEPWAEIAFDLFLPTPTPTKTLTPIPTATSTPRPTNTHPPTNTPPPTSTPLPTMTSTPKPTLRPATPIRIVPTAAPATPTYAYRAPTATSAPVVYVTPTLLPTIGPASGETPPATATHTTVTPEPQSAEGTVSPVPSGTEPAPSVQAATATAIMTVSLATASATPTATLVMQPASEQLSNTGIGPFVMVVIGGLLLGAGGLGLRHLRANLLT